MNKPWGSTNKITNCHTPVPLISWKKKKSRGQMERDRNKKRSNSRL